MTPTKPAGRKKGRKARTWKAWAVVNGDALAQMDNTDPALVIYVDKHDAACMQYERQERVIPVTITERKAKR